MISDDFNSYFKKILLSQQQFASDIHYAALHRTDQSLDRNIYIMEIKDILKCTQEKKAPEIDRDAV